MPSAKRTTDFQVRRWVEDPSGSRLGYGRSPNVFDGLGSPSYIKRRARVPVLHSLPDSNRLLQRLARPVDGIFINIDHRVGAPHRVVVDLVHQAA